MKNIKLELFVRFLKENNSYIKYMKCMMYQKDERFDSKELIKMIGEKDSYEYISRAFLWETTHEGFEYWEDLNDKWQEFRIINNMD